MNALLDSNAQAPPPVRAAEYIRMSTEHQQYSTENQRDAIREYAAHRGYEIVQTYADEGKSGLRIEGRAALKQLLLDVQEGRADYAAILVVDVSRWGRFQDADESAYYEYCCKRAGIAVHYCSEQFENDGGPVSTIVKSVKRAMAGEYSRELSSKVFKGQCRLIELGYRQGGPAGFGLRRMLVDQSGCPKTVLARGEHKSLQTDRVILVPGPDEEVAVVCDIYDMFVRKKCTEGEIAEYLNARGIRTDLDRRWTRGTVQQVLTNEKYIGNSIFNRISFKLKRKRIRNEPDMWIRADHAFSSIVPERDFIAARTIIERRRRRLSDSEMLGLLKDLSAQCRELSARLIDETSEMPNSASYRARFGSLIQAYRQAGYVPARDYRYIEINRNLRQLYPQIIDEVIRRLDNVGATVTQDASSDLLLINGEYSASMVLSRCRYTSAGALRWLVQIDQVAAPDITILVRMNPSNEQPTDFYLLPFIDIDTPRVLLCESNGAHLDMYQFDTLDYFAQLAARATIGEAA